MSSLLILDGKEYTAATAAGKQFGYTKDYLLLLIKNGKVDGQKIGNKWYVHVPSARAFFKEAESLRKARRLKISLARKSELKKHTLKRRGGNHRTAVVETLAILIIGLSVGATGYVGANVQSASISEDAYGALERMAVSFYSFFSSSKPNEAVTPGDVADDDAMDDASSAAVDDVSVNEGFVVSAADVFTAESVDSIRESFSDPVSVSVDPASPDTGIIVPRFRDGDGEAYRFLMVPVKGDASEPKP